MQIQGTVISVSLSTKVAKQGGGTYDAWELVYRTPENEVKQLAKPVQSLKFTKGLKEGLAALATNDEFVAIMEKNAKDYWEVLEIVKGSPSTEARPVKETAISSVPGVERPVQPQRAVNRVTGSTYETPEERAKKQVVIVRQSSVSNAIALLVATNKEGFDANHVVEVAEVFEKFVNKGLKAAAKKYLDIKLNEEDAA